VRGNTVLDIAGLPGSGVGISATGTVTGNYVARSRIAEYEIGQGSTVIGNTAVGIPFEGEVGFRVFCPSNVSDNTALKDAIVLIGEGCNNTNNVGS
jgi:hypothetical protein